VSTTDFVPDRARLELWHQEIREETESGETYYVVTLRELPDFFAAGRTRAEAVANARDALVSHLRSYAARGKQIPAAESTGG
jgi:predicted RNase H-like HicB family nuclease